MAKLDIEVFSGSLHEYSKAAADIGTNAAVIVPAKHK